MVDAHHLGALDELPMTVELARATLLFADELHAAFEAVSSTASKVLDREIGERLRGGRAANVDAPLCAQG